MDCTNRDVCQQVVKGLTLDIPEYCPIRVKTVMAQCWKYLPTERWGVCKIHSRQSRYKVGKVRTK